MEITQELIRPSHNKYRSKAVASLRLVERRETAMRLQQELAIAKQNLEQDFLDSRETRKRIEERKTELKEKENLLEKTSQENAKCRQFVNFTLEEDLAECNRLSKQQNSVRKQMEEMERELIQMTQRLDFLQNYQRNLFEVEGFDRVVDKFQELNHSWQMAAEEYRAIYMDSGRLNRETHPTELGMQHLMMLNMDDTRRIMETGLWKSRNKAARNAHWQISSVAESFKQQGHVYLAILNLASHLSHHPISRTLTNICKQKTGNLTKGRATARKKSSTETKKEESERSPSVEQIYQPAVNYRERWKMLAAAAMSDTRREVRGTDASMSSDFGRGTDSMSLEMQIKDVGMGSATVLSNKQMSINKVAATKLNFIEQILYDLTLIKEEIDFQTDPIHYNDPENSLS